ncbi:MAG: hypothetical protein CMF25_06720 [Kangiellaceae bacterium]|nr:hypothetical protein [Kangiellaceae bacterium]|tara:strand:- start:87 stop:1295 length:1209 start_codon:yes stop_codon:yes gene_type:complete
MQRLRLAVHTLAPTLSLAAGLFCVTGDVLADEWRGNVGAQLRYFQHDIDDLEQHNLSTSGQAEWFKDFNQGNDRLVLSAFGRLDSQDSERNHVDLRELYWLHLGSNWELKVGAIKTFWGVTESQHLVDIINQTDSYEGLDGEDKLGQPAVQFNWINDWGTLEMYWLPYFREREFYQPGSRLAFPIGVSDEAQYESGAEETHQDLALHYVHYIGPLDFGIGYFDGTAREPILNPQASPDGSLELVPYYSQLQQLSLEAQATLGAWLWKLEAVSRKQLDEHYSASVFGVEYTLYGLMDTPFDLGLISEYHFDDRGDNATNALNHDLMLGARFTLNDADSSELLVGMIIDEQSEAKVFSVEASRRFGQHWTLDVEGRWFSDQQPQEALYAMKDNDYVELTVQYHF